MKLLTLAGPGGGDVGAELRSGERLALRGAARAGTAEAWLPASLPALLSAGEEGLTLARRIVERVEGLDLASLDELRAQGALRPAGAALAAPVQPRLIVAAGLAYRSHLAEMAGTPAPPHPTGFLKSPHSVTGPRAVLRLPPQAREQVDYEGELALVFGRLCHGVSAAEAMRCVAGVTVANDLSARDWVRDVWSAETPWEARRTWEVNLMGKQFDGFTPLGPVLLTLDEVPRLEDLRLLTRLNGRVVQDAPVGDLIFPLAETVAHFARWYRFEPGDVLLTGTPAGVGAGRKPPLFLRDGDLVEVEVAPVGCLANRIAAAPGPTPVP
jgi:2-keto-4-pentenoate hydratase/2-oxohepta-3-ene-1,7-dioic acid hydratase in catechol pathway